MGPGYDPSQVPEEPEEEDKSQSGNDSKKPLIKLNFWPGAKKSETSTRKPARFNNQPEIPKITPFVRTTTEFTGWPTEPTTTTRRTTTTTQSTEPTTTTTTTTTTPRPTTPGTCGDSCRLAATMRIVEGRQWSQSLLNPYTDEWQELAEIVSEELERIYLKSSLGKSFERVEVEAFSPGSIVEDYYVVFKELEQSITTQDLKDTVERETRQGSSNMLGNTNLRIDPKYSDFIVVSTLEPQPVSDNHSNDFLPPWAVAVIVIGLASVAFVIVFGVSMLYKKRKIMQGTRKSGKQALNLTEEMVYEMNRSGSASGGYSSGLEAAYHNYGMDMESWKSDKYSNGRYKRGSSSSSGGGTHNGGYSSRRELYQERGERGETSPYQSGLYDSWKTEWNPTYKDYQTNHYPYPTSSYMTKGGRRPSYDDDF